MADIHKFSEQLIEFAERLSNVADAAQGKDRRSANGTTHWVLLPAVGAGLYAVAKSEFFARQAKGAVSEAKTRASDLPNDLMNTVRQRAKKAPSRSGGQGRRQTSPARKTNSARQTSPARKSRSVG
jgi:hypothetical protein